MAGVTSLNPRAKDLFFPFQRRCLEEGSRTQKLAGRRILVSDFLMAEEVLTLVER
jgi:hypothetical protein